jgi:hypothetical protein
MEMLVSNVTIEVVFVEELVGPAAGRNGGFRLIGARNGGVARRRRGSDQRCGGMMRA